MPLLTSVRHLSVSVTSSSSPVIGKQGNSDSKMRKLCDFSEAKGAKMV